MSQNWMPILGEFDVSGKKLIFLGRTIEFDFENEKRSVPAMGYALLSQRFAGGTISATIEFDEVDIDTGCELLPYYDPNSRFSVNAGLGGAFGMFSVRQFDGTKWTTHKIGGDRANLRPHRKYKVRVVVRGSRVTVTVDEVNVLAVDLPYQVPASQVGVWCSARSRVTISDFAVETQRPKAFVVMQFSEPYNELYSEVIKVVCQEFGLDVIRADEEYGPGIIVADVAKQIIESKLIIAEITPSNPNVYYEVGYAHALNKPTILIAERATKLPFDVSPFRTLFYENTINGKAKIEDGLRKHLQILLADTSAV